MNSGVESAPDHSIMRNQFFLAVAVLASVMVAGCNPPDQSGVPEAWTKAPVDEKLERIKKMPISVQMKIDGINNLPISQEQKDKAIAEVRAMPATQPGS
jgi:hypothetical protein